VYLKTSPFTHFTPSAFKQQNINVTRPNTTKARVPVQAQVKKQPAAPSAASIQSQAPVQHQQQLQSHKQQQQPRAVLQERAINQLERDVVTAKKEAVKDKLVPHVPEVVDVAKSATKRVLSTSTTESVLPLLEGVDEAITHEEEENMKRPKRDEHAQWGELEDDDVGDPLMVSEYANQIFEYMQELEVTSRQWTAAMSFLSRKHPCPTLFEALNVSFERFPMLLNR
jgi:hypothetical protein